MLRLGQIKNSFNRFNYGESNAKNFHTVSANKLKKSCFAKMVDAPEIVQKHMRCRPSPAKRRDFELSSVSVGMCYQNAVKRQCLLCGWLVKNVFLFIIMYKLQRSNI
jgi:hypothetical protein